MCVYFQQDKTLLKTLQESLREGEKKMEAVVEEFAVRQEQLQETSGQQSLEGDSCSANEEEDEEDEEEEQEGKEGDGRFVRFQLRSWTPLVEWAIRKLLYHTIDKHCYNIIYLNEVYQCAI